MSSRFLSPVFQAIDNGKAVPGAQLFFYEVGSSTTFKDTFTNATGDTANSNPVVADGSGVFPNIYGNGLYRVVLKYATTGIKKNAQIFERDNVQWTDTANSTFIFNTVADAISGTLPDGSVVSLLVGQTARTLGYNSVNDGGAANYVAVAGDTGTDDGGSFINMDNGLQLKLIVSGHVEVAKFGVGPSSKANAIAFGVASGNRILFSVDTTINVPTDSAVIQDILDVVVVDRSKITIEIEAGHALTAGWKVVDGDYSYFTITSTDATVLLDAGFTPVSTVASPGSSSMVAVYHNVRAPVWDVLLDGANNAIVSAINNTGGSTLNVLFNKGAVRFLNNYLSTASTMWADRAFFYEAGNRGIWATSASTVYAREVDCHTCVDIGIFASRATKMEIDGSDVSGSGVGLRSSSTSCVMAQSLDASNCTENGVVATFAGTAYVGAATIVGCALYGILANEGGRVDASSATITGSGDININANVGGHISCQGAIATGGTNWDLSIAQGGYIYAEGASGVPRVTINTLSDRGVIFQ